MYISEAFIKTCRSVQNQRLLEFLKTKPGEVITNRPNYKLIAIVTSTVAAGVPLWTATGSIDFTSFSFLGLWLLIGVVVSFSTLFFVTLKRNDMIAAFTVGYMLAVITYFVGNILVNQNVYLNLSVALLIAALTGVLAGWSGAAIWKLIKKLSQ